MSPPRVLPPPRSACGRPQAPHVSAAVAPHVQPRLSPEQAGRKQAAHVQAAVSAVQARMPVARPPVPHVQAAPARALPPPVRHRAPEPVQPRMAPHVQAAVKPHHPGAAQAQPAPGPPRTSRPPGSPPAGQEVLQKKVGFEFETGDIRTQMSSWGDWTWRPHPKNSLLYSGDGFELRTDEYKGASQLELILKEIDETNPREVNKLLDSVIPAAIETIETLAKACKAKNGWVAISDIKAIRGWAGWIWNRTSRFQWAGGNSISGQLQATAGLDLSSLANILTGEQLESYQQAYEAKSDLSNDYWEAYVNSGQLLARYGAAPLMADALSVVNQDSRLSNLSTGSRRELAAILALISTIPYNTYSKESEIPYPKSAAGSILARTDLATIVAQLPSQVRQVLSGKLLKSLVLQTVQKALEKSVQENAPVYPKNTRWEQGANVPKLNALTIGRWVEELVPSGSGPGRDLLTQEHFPGNAQTRAWLESMGGFGSKMDPGNRPIFELRSLTQYSALEDLAMNVRFVIEFLNPRLRSALMKRTNPSYRVPPETRSTSSWTLSRALLLMPLPLM